MSKTVVGLFRDFQAAEAVVRDLENSGFTHDHVSIVAGDNNQSGRTSNASTSDYSDGSVAEDTGGGVARGAAIGGGIGLVAGLVALAIPGIGPVLAAGPIAAALTGLGVGAAAGGVIGGLSHAGIPDEDQSHYANRLKNGEVLVSVHADDADASRAQAILQQHGATNVDGDSDATDDSRDAMIRTYDRPSSSNAGYGTGMTAAGMTGATGVGTAGLAESTFTDRADDLEHNARKDWEHTGENAWDKTKQGTENAWDKTKQSVEHGWEKTKETVSSATHSDVRRDDETGSWGDSDKDYQRHYESRYSGLGQNYDYYAPAYNMGSTAATSHAGRQWSDVEPDLRRDWDGRGEGAWDEVKDAVRHGWDKVRGSVSNTAR